MSMAQIVEDGLEDAFQREFRDFMRRQPLKMEMPPLLGFLLIGQLQLALRHPGNNGPGSAQVRAWVDQLIKMLDLPPAMARVAELGWDPDYDQPV